MRERVLVEEARELSGKSAPFFPFTIYESSSGCINKGVSYLFIY